MAINALITISYINGTLKEKWVYLYQIMLTFFIYIWNIQLKVTKSTALNVDLAIFVSVLKQKQTRGNKFAF
jgi:hypothetical protein